MAVKNRKEIDTDFIEPSKVRIPNPQRIAVSKHGMVATAQYLATKVGAEILEQGGNAMDAAVATAFALGVCEPQASGLGGQTMMLVYTAKTGTTVALDGSSRAPNRAVMESVSEKRFRLHGYKASTVPSTPATLGYALERFGTFNLPAILEPVIELAENGYQITELQRRLQGRELRNFRKGNAGAFFLRNGDRPYSVGIVFKQPVLAKTLERLAKEGIEDFYQGKIANLISEDMDKNDGFMQKDDLANIPWPIEREPVVCKFGGMYVKTMPPPGAGRTLVEMLNILRKFPKENRNPDTPKGALLLAETIRRTQLDRRDRPFDPNFYPQVQDRRMLSRSYGKLVSEQIRSRIEKGGETTHLSVMDKHGNVVALTQSIERVYGAKVVTPKLGFLYNNYMSAFDYQDISHPYYLRPNGVPWASVAPTIIFRSDAPWLAIGSPGSDRITSTIVQILLRLAWQSPFDAVAAPRLHCTFDGKVSLEASYMRDDIPELLKERGFEIDIREPMSFYLGSVQMVLFERGEFIGVADPRRDGSALGARK
ncbi:MAG: gamma-glutamyltransferase family protein [Desulfobacteraceae bacterium]|uniref:Gamma-glutamyltransferase family protein n=1 Tax=Candidatus Desulfacyla euxinica TaxID=2841693 RepID=A0A8J6N2A9_9DELT|nr:gamma-glutamyltransferase family protein [Candidatus Desulfacyla euxinica]MBL6977343.1 gamma-glutamyltransferase family protein [Desulfobacteraceae bacterium]